MRALVWKGGVKTPTTKTRLISCSFVMVLFVICHDLLFDVFPSCAKHHDDVFSASRVLEILVFQETDFLFDAFPCCINQHNDFFLGVYSSCNFDFWF